MKGKNFFLLFIFCFLLFINLQAGAGRAGWTIFKKVQSSKFKGIVTVASVRGDLSGMFYNPAVLGTGEERELFLLSELGFAEDKFGGVVYGQPVTKGMFAAGFIYYDAGIMELNWIENDELKTKNVAAQRDLLGIVSYGRKLGKKLYFGGSIKYAKSEVAEVNSAEAYAADLGLLFTAGRMSVSLAGQNLGDTTNFLSKKNPLPSSLYTGFGYSFGGIKFYFSPVAGVTYNLTETRLTPDFGLELGTGNFSINTGYRLDEKGESNLVFGLGIQLKSFDFGYGYLPGINLNPVHRVSMGFKFGK